jgi:phenylacetate-CoA ligase
MISIVVPCFNEEGNLEALLERLSQALRNNIHEIVLVDDGSLDSTFATAENLTNVFTNMKILRHPENRGIAEAWRTGVQSSSFDIVCLIDADLQNPPEAIPEMLDNLLATQVDFVQGARSSIGRLKDQRMFFSRTLNFLLNKIFSQNSIDSKSGFVIGYKVAFEDVLGYKKKYKYFQTFLGVVIRNKGYVVNEIETLFQSREVGESFISKRRPLFVIIGVLFDFFPAVIEFRKKESFIGQSHIKVTKHRQKNLVRQLFFDLYFATSKIHKWIISSESKKFYYWLKATEYLSRDDLQALQQKRLKKLVNHAYHHVPYYKKKFTEAKLNIQDLIRIDELPLLTKNDVRENIHFFMFSDLHDKKYMHRIQTSGSTGQPFVCYADKFQLEMRFATTLRALEMTGWAFGDKQLRLWHQTLGMTRIQTLKEKLDAIFMRRTFVPAFELTSESIEELLALIERIKPVLVDGYAESFNFIASGADRSLRHRPRAVMSSAQQLTDATRTNIEQKFGTKVFDKYGSREFSGIAYQCREGKNHHVQDESYLVELLVDGRHAKPGEVGEIVVTDLNNYSVPLIRYRIGDLAVAVEQTPCQCGRSQMQIGEITGRTQALIACRNGVWLPGTFFAHFFKDFDFAIKHFQVYQAEFGEFEIRVIPTARYSPAIAAEMLEGLHRYTSPETVIDFKVVSEIPMERTGKRTPVISKINQDYQLLPSNKLQRDLD